MHSVNDFRFEYVDRFDRPVWRFKSSNRFYCVVDRLVSHEGVTDELLYELLKDINSQTLELYSLTDNEWREPDSPVSVGQIPEDEIIVNRKTPFKSNL